MNLEGCRMLSVVEFEYADPARFDLLVRLVEALATAKLRDDYAHDAFWEGFLDERARRAFWWPTPEELADWERRWLATPVHQRWSDPSLKTPWVYGSVIEAVKDGEYRLDGVVRCGDNLAAIEFEPKAHPFGGCGWMHAVIEAFGGSVTGGTEE